MSISLRTHKILWGRSGNKCAFEGCRCDLAIDEFDQSSSLIGEEAHIVARSNDGPRGISNLTNQERDQFENLILLCRNHHKRIDDNPDVYTVEILAQMKQDHENWVRDNLQQDREQIRQEIECASIVDSWAEKMDINNWIDWATPLITDYHHRIIKDFFHSFEETEKYLSSRYYPSNYPTIERSLKNFKKILRDFRLLYSEHRDEWDEFYETRKFYRGARDQEHYDHKLKEYNYYCFLLGDLALELTRAANYVCTSVRNTLSSKFRFEEGALLYDHDNFHLAEYKENDLENLYPGLWEFMEIRATREFNYDSGRMLPEFAHWERM